MNKKLLAGIFVTGALVASGAASAVSCNTLGTTGAWAGAVSCTDSDNDTLLTFGASTLPLNTGFSVVEVQIGGQDFYNIGFDWHGNPYAGGGSIAYSVTALTGDIFVGANLDTVVLGDNTLAEKILLDASGGLIRTLVSVNGSHDPIAGGDWPILPQVVINVVDNFLVSPTGGVYLHADNSIVAIPEPDALAMMLAGLGIMGFIVRRKLQNLA